MIWLLHLFGCIISFSLVIVTGMLPLCLLNGLMRRNNADFSQEFATIGETEE